MRYEPRARELMGFPTDGGSEKYSLRHYVVTYWHNLSQINTIFDYQTKSIKYNYIIFKSKLNYCNNNYDNYFFCERFDSQQVIYVP
jgi:hypothetical protein